MAEQFWATVKSLEPLHPEFVSVTYGAGGGTRAETLATVLRLRKETALQPAAHLTCIGAGRLEIDQILDEYHAAGVTTILALRGDAPPGAAYAPRPDGYVYAADLVAAIRQRGDFHITVAAYPETHPEAKTASADLDNLKRKIDAGADRVITQFFFDPEVFLRFRDRAQRAGVTVPIIPGILPVSNYAKVVEFSGRCGTSIPAWMAEMFDGLDGDPETRKLVAATIAAEQCRALMAEGIDEFHFYTLNRSDLTLGICRRLGLKPQAVAGAAGALALEMPSVAVDPQSSS